MQRPRRPGTSRSNTTYARGKALPRGPRSGGGSRACSRLQHAQVEAAAGRPRITTISPSRYRAGGVAAWTATRARGSAAMKSRFRAGSTPSSRRPARRSDSARKPSHFNSNRKLVRIEDLPPELRQHRRHEVGQRGSHDSAGQPLFCLPTVVLSLASWRCLLLRLRSWPRPSFLPKRPSSCPGAATCASATRLLERVHEVEDLGLLRTSGCLHDLLAVDLQLDQLAAGSVDVGRLCSRRT